MKTLHVANGKDLTQTWLVRSPASPVPVGNASAGHQPCPEILQVQNRYQAAVFEFSHTLVTERPFTKHSVTHSALQTSEETGNLIAKRPEREFSLGVATAQISAEAVAGVLIRLLLQWIGYRTLAENFGEW